MDASKTWRRVMSFLAFICFMGSVVAAGCHGVVGIAWKDIDRELKKFDVAELSPQQQKDLADKRREELDANPLFQFLPQTFMDQAQEDQERQLEDLKKIAEIPPWFGPFMGSAGIVFGIKGIAYFAGIIMVLVSPVAGIWLLMGTSIISLIQMIALCVVFSLALPAAVIGLTMMYIMVAFFDIGLIFMLHVGRKQHFSGQPTLNPMQAPGRV